MNEGDGIVDSLFTLLPEDDAATVNWGTEWRIPTFEELSELEKYCERSLTEQNGVYGAKFTAKNGNSIFLPAAGFRKGSELINASLSLLVFITKQSVLYFRLLLGIS